MNPAQLLGKRCNEWQYQTVCWVLTFAGLVPGGLLHLKKITITIVVLTGSGIQSINLFTGQKLPSFFFDLSPVRYSI